MVERRLSGPQVVEVVDAESVEAAMSQVAAELAALEHELRKLNAQAAELEHHVEQARARPGDSAFLLLEQVFLEQTAVSQAELLETLEEAVADAEGRIASAFAEKDAMVAEVPSGNGEPADTPAYLSVTPLRNNSFATPSDLDAPAEPDTTLVHESLDLERATTTVVSLALPESEATQSDQDDDFGAFGRFWDAGNPASALRDARAGVVDALLPLLAVGIIVIVLLSWIG